jgi:hypothetical protein
MTQPICPECNTSFPSFTSLAVHRENPCGIAGLKFTMSEETKHALREAAEIAKSFGYEFDYEPRYQPWASEANQKLEWQRQAISREILKLIPEGEVG